MTKYYHKIPDQFNEYVHGNIESVEVDNDNISQWKNIILYDSEKEARIAWYKQEYPHLKDISDDSCFDENGYLKE